MSAAADELTQPDPKRPRRRIFKETPEREVQTILQTLANQLTILDAQVTKIKSKITPLIEEENTQVLRLRALGQQMQIGNDMVLNLYQKVTAGEIPPTEMLPQSTQEHQLSSPRDVGWQGKDN